MSISFGIFFPPGAKKPQLRGFGGVFGGVLVFVSAEIMIEPQNIKYIMNSVANHWLFTMKSKD